jgi:hypothetical protein
MTTRLFLIAIILLLMACSNKVATVKGTLCFPSEYIPKMNVYLKESKSNKTYKLITTDNQQSFKFKRIPFGDYQAYAYTAESLGMDTNGKNVKSKGGYTHAVPCGLTVKCNDHRLILIKLRTRSNKEAIKICDWYGADVPPEN